MIELSKHQIDVGKVLLVATDDEGEDYAVFSVQTVGVDYEKLVRTTHISQVRSISSDAKLFGTRGWAVDEFVGRIQKKEGERYGPSFTNLWR